MSLDKINRRKKELQAEIDRIEKNYIRKASDIERKIKSVMRPVHSIRKKPFISIGISVTAGFAIGFLSKKKSRKSKSHKTGESRESTPSAAYNGDGTGFTTLLMAELKRLAAQRAMIYVSELIDQKVMPRFMNDTVAEEKKQTDRDMANKQ